MFFPLIDVIRYSHIAFKENLQRESKSRCLNGLLTANQRKRKKYHQLSKVRQDLTVNRQTPYFIFDPDMNRTFASKGPSPWRSSV